MSNSEKDVKKDSGPDPIALLGIAISLLGCLWWNKNSNKVYLFYFEHYETIYLIGWGLVLLCLLGVIYFIKKKTKNLAQRGNLLSPLWATRFDKILVGKTYDEVDLHLSDSARCAHVQIIGSTGRGKTKSVIIPWALRDLARSQSVILIDGKGSKDIPETIKAGIDRHLDAKFYLFDLESKDSVKINPLKNGSALQIVDRIFSAFDFEDPFYRSVQYDICGYLVKLIIESKTDVTFKLLYDLLTDDKKLCDLLTPLSLDHPLKKKLMEYLRTTQSDRASKMAGLISQLSPFAESELSHLVNGGVGEVELSNVMNATSPASILVMSIPTLKYQKIGHQLGKIVLQDLAWAIGDREKNEFNHFASVFLDEFSEFAYEGFVSILNKARSAKVALHLSHQALSDLTKVSIDFANSVNTNTNIKCIMGLNDPETADFYARHIGTKTEKKLTEQVEERGFFKNKDATGRGSIRDVESYKVHPNQLKQLSNGRGVLHLPTDKGAVTEIIQFEAISLKELRC